MKRGVGVVPGVAVPATFIAGHFHQEVVRIELPEDVAINIGAVAGAADDILAGEAAVHRSASLGGTCRRVGHIPLRSLDDVVGVEWPAVAVPLDDGRLLEEYAPAVVDVRDSFFCDPAVERGDRRVVGQEVGELLDGHFALNRLVVLERAVAGSPERFEEVEGFCQGDSVLFFRNGLQAFELHVKFGVW